MFTCQTPESRQQVLVLSAGYSSLTTIFVLRLQSTFTAEGILLVVLYRIYSNAAYAAAQNSLFIDTSPSHGTSFGNYSQYCLLARLTKTPASSDERDDCAGDAFTRKAYTR